MATTITPDKSAYGQLTDERAATVFAGDRSGSSVQQMFALVSVAMIPQEIISGAQELAKTGVALGAALPFTSLVKKILGPAADEIAERVRDEIRLYRYGRQLSLLHKAEGMAAKAGFTPRAVPIKPLFSLLEGASLEENEDLHTKWAALLANAANPNAIVAVRPSFMDTLRLLTPDTVMFLDAVFARALEASRDVTADSQKRRLALANLGTESDLFTLYCQTVLALADPDQIVTSASTERALKKDESDRMDFSILMSELNRFQMWSTHVSNSMTARYYLSAYAVEFLFATHPPA